jgi:uncharacterized protein with HEPN domain
MRRSDPRPWLHDILEAIVGARGAVGDMTLDAYVASWTTRRAVERAIEIISEATRHLPERLRSSEPDVPWREIASIGNVLRHAYHRVDDEVILRDRDAPARAAGNRGTEAARSSRRRGTSLRAGTGESSASAS